MPLASGLAGQVGYGDEVTVGTAVTPTRFLPLVSESMSQERERLESEGIIAGRRVLMSQQWNGGPISVSGDVQHELYNRGLGLLFKHMFGSLVTAGVAAPYTHTATPGDLSGKALTVQVGRPGVAGVVHPFTYAGCKVASWELACSAGEIATLGLSLVGMTETTATALAAATYPTAIKPLKFNHGVARIAGTAANVRAVTLSGDNGLADDRRFLGTETVAEPLEQEKRTYEGTLEVEFTDLTQYNRYVNATETALELDFTAGADKVVITANVRYDGSTPQVGGRELLTHDLPFKCVASGADSTAITAVLTNGDATP